MTRTNRDRHRELLEAIRAIDPAWGRSRIQAAKLIWANTFGRPDRPVRWVEMSERFVAQELAISRRHAIRTLAELHSAQVILRRKPATGRRPAAWGMQLDVEAWNVPADVSQASERARLGLVEVTSCHPYEAISTRRGDMMSPLRTERPRNAVSEIAPDLEAADHKRARTLGITGANGTTTVEGQAGETITGSRSNFLGGREGGSRRPRDPDTEQVIRVCKARMGVGPGWRIYGWPRERLRELVERHGADALSLAAHQLPAEPMPAVDLPAALEEAFEHWSTRGRPRPKRRPELLAQLIAARSEGGEPPAGTAEAAELAALRAELEEAETAAR